MMDADNELDLYFPYSEYNGEDAVFIKGKRFEYAFNLGKKEVINELHVLLNKIERSDEK